MTRRSWRDGCGSCPPTVRPADSPVLRSLTTAKPSLASAGGERLHRIGNQTAAVQYRAAERTGEVTEVVANRHLVTVQGRGVTEPELMNFATTVRYTELEPR